MVEGPTAHAYSMKIKREMLSEKINNIFYRSKKVYVARDDLIGKKISDSETIGKNILIHVDGYTIRIHLMLYGSIHIYGKDDKLLKPFEKVRLLIEGNEKKLVVYNAPIVEIGYRNKILDSLNALGPDPLRDDWDREEAIKRIKMHKGVKIGVVLLDQNVIAGIGNILRNEILFRAGVHPERLVDDLRDEEIEKIVDISRELMNKFLELKIARKRIKPLLYVYNRYNKKCKICGNPIKFYIQSEVGRKTFVCEHCQK